MTDYERTTVREIMVADPGPVENQCPRHRHQLDGLDDRRRPRARGA